MAYEFIAVMEGTLKELERQFYSDGFRLGMKAAENRTDQKAFALLVAEMYSKIDEFIDSFLALVRQNNQRTDCKSGCQWCCHQPVFVLSYELQVMQLHLTEKYDMQTCQAILNRARSKRQKMHGLSGEALLNSKFPCPLLSEGRCMAYAMRPMACRIYLSTDLNTCLHFFHKPDDPENYPALLHFPMRTGRLMNEGFKVALTANGEAVVEHTIEEGMRNWSF